MITIDARTDTHKDYRSQSITGAVAKHVLPLKVGGQITVAESVDKSGREIEQSRIMASVVRINRCFNCHVSTQNNEEGNLVLEMVKLPSKHKNQRKRTVYPKCVRINAETDWHESYRDMGVIGAIAKHILPLKVGDVLNIINVVDALGKEVDYGYVRAHIGRIGKQNGAKLSTRMGDDFLTVTMIKEPTITRKLGFDIRDGKKEYIANHVNTEKEPISINRSMANKFLTGGFSNVQPSAN